MFDANLRYVPTGKTVLVECNGQVYKAVKLSKTRALILSDVKSTEIHDEDPREWWKYHGRVDGTDFASTAEREAFITNEIARLKAKILRLQAKVTL